MARDCTLTRTARLLDALIETLKEIPDKRQVLAAFEAQKCHLQKERERLLAELKSGESNRAVAQKALDDFKEHREHLAVHNTHRELRTRLKKGAPCPVCEQTVEALPQIPALGALAEAVARVKGAEDELRKIQNALIRTESQVDSLPRRLAEIDIRYKETADAIDRVIEKVHALVGEVSDAECLDVLTRAVLEIRVIEQELTVCDETLKQSDQEARRASRRGQAAR